MTWAILEDGEKVVTSRDRTTLLHIEREQMRESTSTVVQGREWIELEACERNVSYLFKSKVATWQFLSHHFCGSCVVEMFAVCQCHNYCLRPVA